MVSRVIDYGLFYKRRYSSAKDIDEAWDIFISAYDGSERVLATFDAIAAYDKHWLIHSEYNIGHDKVPDGRVFAPTAVNEAEYVAEYIGEATIGDIRGLRICVDITGFMRPHLMFLVKWLKNTGISVADFLYTEPGRYVHEEWTEFAQGPVIEVRQVAGYEGLHIPDASGADLLIIGMGYDHELIKKVAEDKASSEKLQLFGFPPLSAEMYQESVLRANFAGEALGPLLPSSVLRAPANDPFATASVIQEAIEREKHRRDVKNLYLCPLGTKAQVLGFALYYISECESQAASVIFPFTFGYAPETTEGVLGTWKYRVEF